MRGAAAPRTPRLSSKDALYRAAAKAKDFRQSTSRSPAAAQTQVTGFIPQAHVTRQTPPKYGGYPWSLGGG